MKKMLLLVLIGCLGLGLASCGQRVYPKEPEGKLNPSKSF